jgi:hypothetical protein
MTSLLFVSTLLAQLDTASAPPEDTLPAPTPAPAVSAEPPSASTTAPAPAPDIGAFNWSPRAELFGQFEVGKTDSAGTYDQFDVPRVHVGAEAQWHGVSGRLLIEGTRSTAGGALIGTAGDSIVVRIREAWAGYRYGLFEARLGMIPTPVIAVLERAFANRALTPDGLELYGLDSPADLGATVRAHLPSQLGWVALTATNGEGYTFRELNTGKNFELSALIKPIGALSLLATGRIGSTGLAQVRSDRVGGAALWTTETLGLGVNAFYAVGVSDDAGLRSLLLQAFARGTLFDRVLWAVRVHRMQRDLDAVADDSLTTVLASGGVHVIGPLDVYLCFQKTWASSVARAALPGSDAISGRIVVSLRYPEASPLE